MFDSEVTINAFLIRGFERILRDIPAAEFFRRGAGHGHPPVWIVGHLAICAELGEKFLGKSMTHPEWMPMFGPGSSDAIPVSPEFNRESLGRAVVDGYGRLRELAMNATAESVVGPHGVTFFHDTPIVTVGHCISLLLTNHFGFHMAQLSSCRRELGFERLF